MEKLPADERRVIFENYWRCSSWQAQSIYILSCVDVIQPKRSCNPQSRKTATRIFKFSGTRVCKNVFLNTLGITHGRLITSL